MKAFDIIKKKRDGFELTKQEIEFFIENYTAGVIPDYQASAFLMAVFFQKMTKNFFSRFWFSFVKRVKIRYSANSEPSKPPRTLVTDEKLKK